MFSSLFFYSSTLFQRFFFFHLIQQIRRCEADHFLANDRYHSRLHTFRLAQRCIWSSFGYAFGPFVLGLLNARHFLRFHSRNVHRLPLHCLFLQRRNCRHFDRFYLRIIPQKTTILSNEFDHLGKSKWSNEIILQYAQIGHIYF